MTANPPSGHTAEADYVITNLHHRAASSFLFWPRNFNVLIRDATKDNESVAALAEFIARWEAKGKTATIQHPAQSTLSQGEVPGAEAVAREKQLVLIADALRYFERGDTDRDQALTQILAALRQPVPVPAPDGLPLSVEYADTLEQLKNTHCDVQFALATALAANVGYVLTPEPMIDPVPAPGVTVTDEMIERARLKILPFIFHLARSVQMEVVRFALSDALRPKK